MTTVLTDNAMTILNKRYLEGESVDSMWDRVSGGNPAYRRLLSELRFLPNSPTLFNAGRNNGCTLSACFVFDVGDSMFGKGSITETRNKAIAVAKAGGGVGYWFGQLRPKGSPIKSIQRVACGPVAVLRDYNAIAKLITQGGKRELAQMGVLDCDHPDVREFVHCKDDDPQGLGSFNISVGWKNSWVDEVFAGNGDSAARSLWDEQCRSAWSHGCPGMLFPDVVNGHNINRHLGLINSTNPCGETPNRSDEPCNLGSLALPRYFLPGNRDVDWGGLEEDAYLATSFLDDVLDRNEFPHPDVTRAALLTRKLGLGVMGWADLLAMMHIHYDTDKTVTLGGRLMKLIADVSHQASEDLARKKGPYLGYNDRTEGPCRRNETTTSIAPTGTIAIIAGVWASIEPHFALRCERTTNEGIKLQDGVQDWVWEKLDGFVPKTAGEVAPEWHVRHQAAFQAHTDLGVSKTVNLPHSATVEDVSRIYRLMYESGCKGGTIFRDGCRDEQVLVSRKTASVYGVATRSSPGGVDALPPERGSVTHKFRVGDTTGFLTVGLFPDGKPAEIFLRVSKIGSSVGGMLDTWAISFSIALQNGTPLEAMCEHHVGTRFEPSGTTGHADIPVASSIPDYVCRWLVRRFVHAGDDGQADKTSAVHSGQLCPDCGAEVLLVSGCLTCPAAGCGWTRCG